MKVKSAIALVLVLACLLCACGVSQRSLVGSWKYQQTVLGVVTETTYVFNEDGTGTIKNIVDVNFTYTLTEDQLEITTTVLGISATESYTVRFEGGQLILSNEKDTMRLEKIK